MSDHAAQLGEVVDVRAAAEADEPNHLVRDKALEVVALHVAAGQHKPTYAAPGDVVVYCLKGEIIVRQREKNSTLKSGQLLHYTSHEAQSIEAVRDSEVLIVSARCADLKLPPAPAAAKRATGKSGDTVQEASEESFPASDAPGWTPLTSS